MKNFLIFFAMSHLSLTQNLTRFFVVSFVLSLTFFSQLSSSYAESGVWEVVGTTGFTAAQVSGNDIIADNTGNVYVAYRDEGFSNKISVMHYDGSAWSYLGQRGASDGEGYNPVLAFDNSGNLYVAYNDVSRSWKTSIIKYNGTSWQNHATGIGDTSYSRVGFEIDNSNNLFFVCKNDSNKLVVQKKTPSGGWMTLTDGNLETNDVDLVIERSTGIPYIVSNDRNSNKAVVLKYTGSWESVGGNASETYAPNVKIDIDSQGVPYITYSYSSSIYVRKFNGASWENVGTLHDSANSPNIVFGSNDTLHICYKAASSPYKLSAKKFNGSSWQDLGSSNFTGGNSVYAAMTSGMVGFEDAFYVFYRDEANGGQGTVMRYIVPNNPPTLDFTEPNGLMDRAGASFEIKWTDEDELDDASIALYYDADSTGSDGTLIVENLSEDDETDAYTWDTNAVADGDYYIYAILDDGKNDPVTVYSSNVVTVDHSGAVNDWEVVGERGFTPDVVSYTDMAVDSNGVIYFAYKNNTTDKVNVWKFTDSSWELVGVADFSLGAAEDISIVIDSMNVPYISYTDATRSYKATVEKFNGSAWEVVGSRGFSEVSARHNHLDCDDSDTLYIGYPDSGYSGKLTIKKLNGSDWETLGSRGISTGQMWKKPSFDFDSDNMLYVAYVDLDISKKGVVRRFNGSSWELVGLDGLTPADSLEIAITIDSSDIPYVIYSDGSNGGKAIVQKFNGLDWETVGTAGFSEGEIKEANILVDHLNNIYVGFRDVGLSYTPVVKMFNGVDWETVGSAGFTNEVVSETELAVDSDRTLYYGFNDSSPTYNQHGTVMKFEQPNSPPAITITQPDGVNDSSTSTFNIQWEDSDLDDDASIALYYDTDNTGQDGTLIASGISEDDADDSYTWNTSSLTTGDYYIYAIISDGTNSDVIAYSSGPVNVTNDSGGGEDPPPETGSGIFEQGSGGMYYDGNIGIGTGDSLSLNERLMVNGRIKAHELILENTGWADFVFADDYDLRSLSDLEAFIESNGHLPDIPSAETVQQAGTAIGELQPKLLQKIEELTLYLLQMWRENEEMRRRLEKLEQK